MADRRFRLRGILPLVVAALVAYLPLILSSPGKVGADTKTYLYLDPGRLLGSATSLWDSDTALGTVTHQNIGYLWPMGPFYWLLDALGSPDWFAQRLWVGSLLFAAGAGVHFLLRTLDWQGGGLLVAMLAYELSPYALDYTARISAVLLPWAGLPWMIALTIRAARTGGWRHPALFALVTLTVGSVNATSLLLVGIAPVLWLVHAAWVECSVSPRDAVRAALRIGTTSLGVSLWWIAGLALQGGYSLPVTRYTETYEVVADASSAPEVFRGLGYWFFYGNDKFGQWIEPSIEYTQGVWLHFLSYGLVVLALLGAGLVQWRHRSYFVLLIVVGGLVAIGAHPFDGPSFLGSIFRSFTETDAGLALRSTPRALPMLVLATAVLLGTVVNALERRWPVGGRQFAALVLAAVVLNNPAMWRVRMIEEHLQRDEDIPQYWLEAIDALDASGRDGRVLELPGSDFASYRWGNTVDPITPGLLERGYVARELVPFGSAESAALLTAYDRRFQEDTVDLDAIVPVAQLLSVDDIVHRADLTFERFRTPRPVPTAALLDAAPNLGGGVGYGAPVANVAGPEQTMLDEVFLATDPTLADPSPVTVHEVPDALSIVRLRSSVGSTVIVGDAEGLVDAAGAGLLDVKGATWFAGDLLADDGLREAVFAEPTRIVLTDTNKKRAKRWGTLRENLGVVERAGEEPLRDDPTDNRLPLFPALETRADLDADDSRTVALQSGQYTVQATAYGNPVTYTNDDRPFYAADGDIDTAWVVAAFGEARGEFLEFVFSAQTMVSQITLVQPQTEANRHVTEVEVRADGRSLGRFPLSEQGRGPEGELIIFEPVRASVIQIELTDLDFPVRATYAGVSPVGFAEVRLGANAAAIEESLRTPLALVESLGDELDRHDLSVVLTRERSNPQEPVRDDPEPEMHRTVVLPAARSFEIEGAARLSASAPEEQIDALLGRTQTSDGVGLGAHSSGHLPGHLSSAASFAFDDDPMTAWTGVFGPQSGQWIELALDEPLMVQDLRVDLVADEVHSLAREIAVFADGDHVADLTFDGSPSAGVRGQTIRLDIALGRVLSTLRLEAVKVDERITRDWYSNAGVALPIAIADIWIGDGVRFAAPSDIDTGCRHVLSVDGEGIEARISGSAEDALARRELAVIGCATVTTNPGGFRLDTQSQSHGIDLDQVVLRSRRDTSTAPPLPPVEVISHDDTSYELVVPASADDRWLVLGQSRNDGWRASLGGRDLGPPRLIDGFANGWLLPAGADMAVSLRWTPQRTVVLSLWISAVAILIVIMLAVRGRRDDGPARATRTDGGSRPTLAAVPWVVRSTPHPQPGATRSRLVVAIVMTGGFALLNLPRWHMAALLVGAVSALSLARPRWWTRPSIFAALSLGFAALSIMVDQRRFRHPPDFVWPQQFENVHVLGVLALVLLFADYVRSALRPSGEVVRP